ncbi:hypothetical protein ORL59_00010 [Bacillus cereus]|uniref:hypothetical protein n=1 Tax=Bacillus cereus TaxID=1396 RepID=UPI002AC13D7C|nr:hypothetical protein [Bacillus cereus]MDZ4412005.1 hypothetical protein [Bacillus cereus]
MSESKLFRVNARISTRVNEWMDKESDRTGLSKSVLIAMACEQYMELKEKHEVMKDTAAIFRKLEELERKISVNENK